MTGTDRKVPFLKNRIHRWRRENRYKAVMSVCLPLVMSMAATTVMEFTDRVFLSWYSLDAIAAVTPAGIAAFLFLAFFGGVAAYIMVFIAQYKGSDAHERIGSALWQGIYFSLASGLIMAGLTFFITGPLFTLGGHPKEVQVLEALYFNILCRGSVFHIIVQALASFFTGRGVTRPVMVINLLGMVFNIPLNYVLINGYAGFPEMGIQGAAIATVAAWAVMTILFVVLIFTRENEAAYGVIRNFKPDTLILRRLITYGVPGALQFCMDVFAFTFFVFMVGRIGKDQLAATNIVFSISSIAFMPAMGFSHGVSTLVGQALGAGKPDQARSVTLSAIHILMGYTFFVGLLFIFAPETVLILFVRQGVDHMAIMSTGKILLRIVSFYILMDALYMTFIGVLKGAGDTRFIMFSIGFVSIFVMVIPLYVCVTFLNIGVVQAWYFVLLFISSLFLVSFFRYRQGKWKTMLVVEKKDPPQNPL